VKPHPNAWNDKAELEKYLSDQVDGKPVYVVEEYPVFVKEVSLLKFGLIGSAMIYQGEDGKLHAALVPFGVGTASAA
jgi:hypothetical protein